MCNMGRINEVDSNHEVVKPAKMYHTRTFCSTPTELCTDYIPFPQVAPAVIRI
jgi:hypothetical protein